MPDVVILDLDMPGGDGVSAVADLKQALPQVRVLILTVHSEHERLLPLLEAGVRGYLTKEGASRDLVEAIRVVASGEIAYKRRVQEKLGLEHRKDYVRFALEAGILGG